MEKSSSKVTVVSIILALVCVGILGGIVYFKLHKKEEVKEPVTNEKENEPINEPENNEQEEEPEDNYESIAKELYAIIGYNPEFRDTEIVKFETLSENVRDSIVLNNLSDTCEETKTVDKAIFDAKYKEIFNQEKTTADGICTVSGTNYECKRYCNEFGEKIFSKYEKYELNEDTIIIYENAGHLDYMDDGKVYLKEKPLDTTAIASFDTIDDLKDSTVEYKLPEYKHTFAKVDEKYYWVSSESVKQ